MTVESPIALEIQVLSEDATNEEIDKLARNLLMELRKTNVESVTLTSAGTAPLGSKGDPVTIGSLAVEVLPTAIPALIMLVQTWIMRGQNRTVKFKGKGFEFEGSPEELQKLLNQLDKGKKK